MNVLIIGLGSIANRHINTLHNLLREDVQFYALRSSKFSLPKDTIENIYSLDELKIDPDFIIISNPTILHEETIIECLKFEKPLFIEKPSLHSLKNAAKIADEIKQKNILTYVGCNLRFHPALNFIKKLIATSNISKINEVNVYCGSYLPEWRPQLDFRKNYSANVEMGGGVHLDLIHELDYVYWMLGCPINVQRTFRHNSHLKISAIDYANYLLDYKDYMANIILNYYRRDAKRSLEIICEDATYQVDLLLEAVFKNKELIFGDEKKKLDVDAMYALQMKYFLDSLNKKKSMNSFDDSLEVLKICIGN